MFKTKIFIHSPVSSFWVITPTQSHISSFLLTSKTNWMNYLKIHFLTHNCFQSQGEIKVAFLVEQLSNQPLKRLKLFVWPLESAESIFVINKAHSEYRQRNVCVLWPGGTLALFFVKEVVWLTPWPNKISAGKNLLL